MVGNFQNGPNMGGGEESEESEDDELERTITDYNKKTLGFFILFSELSPRRFVRRFSNYMREKDIAVELSATEW